MTEPLISRESSSDKMMPLIGSNINMEDKTSLTNYIKKEEFSNKSTDINSNHNSNHNGISLNNNLFQRNKEKKQDSKEVENKENEKEEKKKVKNYLKNILKYEEGENNIKIKKRSLSSKEERILRKKKKK